LPSSHQEGSGDPDAFTWDFSPTWDFHTGKRLKTEDAPLDELDLTLWQSTYAALTLVHVVAGGGRPGHDTDEGKVKPTLDLAEKFDSYVLEVRGGKDPLAVATNYLPRNIREKRKDGRPGRRNVIAALLTTAAAAESPDSAVPALLTLCQSSGARAVDENYDVVPAAGDRRTALQPRWRRSLLDGAWLIGLRGARRCLGCESRLSEVGSRWVRRQEVSDRPGGRLVENTGRREDYCGACSSGRMSKAGAPIPSVAEFVRATHNERIRTVLDAAEPALVKGTSLEPPAK